MNTTKVAKPIINDNVSNIVIVFTSVRIEGGATSSNYLSQQYSTLHSTLQTEVHFLFVHKIFLPGQLWPGLFFVFLGLLYFVCRFYFRNLNFCFCYVPCLPRKVEKIFAAQRQDVAVLIVAAMMIAPLFLPCCPTLTKYMVFLQKIRLRVKNFFYFIFFGLT